MPDEAVPQTVTPLTEPPKRGKTKVATGWPVSKFVVDDSLTITNVPQALSAEDTKKALEAAEANDVKLVTIHTEEEAK